MPATLHALPTPHHQDPASAAALAALIQHGVTVSAAAAELAEVERLALKALAGAAVAATEGLLAQHDSVEAAREAGLAADISDAARHEIAGRILAATGCHERAARAVRRAVALQIRLANPRAAREPHPASVAAAPAGPRRPANDTDRADRADSDDEIAGLSTEQVMHAIRRDLAEAALPASAEMRGAGSVPQRWRPGARALEGITPMRGIAPHPTRGQSSSGHLEFRGEGDDRPLPGDGAAPRIPRPT